MLPQQLTQLKTDEGFRAYVYDDATGIRITPGYTCVGHPTVGYGTALDVRGLTEDEATLLLQNELANQLLELNQLAWFALLDDVRKGVIQNLAYNIGVSGVEGFHHMIAAIKVRDWNMARIEMEDSHWAQQVGHERVARLTNQLWTGAL